MISIFTVPKPFSGNIATLQRNAIQSWIQLHPAIEVMLMGNDAGIKETADAFGLKHLPDIEYNEYGTPLVNDAFERAQAAAKNHLVCYVNTDIILLNDFTRIVQGVSARFERFLAIGQRWDLDMSMEVDFSDENWGKRLFNRIRTDGRLHPKTGMDYFLFPRGMLQGIPSFAVGRTFWDGWLVYKARSMRVPVVDFTKQVTAIHQNHDYGHHADGTKGVWEGPEAGRNRQLSGGFAYFFTIGDADWTFDKQSRLVRKFSINYFFRQFVIFPVMFPCSRWKNPLLRLIWRPLILINTFVSKSVMFLKKRYVAFRN